MAYGAASQGWRVLADLEKLPTNAQLGHVVSVGVPAVSSSNGRNLAGPCSAVGLCGFEYADNSRLLGRTLATSYPYSGQGGCRVNHTSGEEVRRIALVPYCGTKSGGSPAPGGRRNPQRRDSGRDFRAHLPGSAACGGFASR